MALGSIIFVIYMIWFLTPKSNSDSHETADWVYKAHDRIIAERAAELLAVQTDKPMSEGDIEREVERLQNVK